MSDFELWMISNFVQMSQKYSSINRFGIEKAKNSIIKREKSEQTKNFQILKKKNSKNSITYLNVFTLL